jgi:hypothetical protein
MMLTWKFPSPAWPKLRIGRRTSSPCPRATGERGDLGARHDDVLGYLDGVDVVGRLGEHPSRLPELLGLGGVLGQVARRIARVLPGDVRTFSSWATGAASLVPVDLDEKETADAYGKPMGDLSLAHKSTARSPMNSIVEGTNLRRDDGGDRHSARRPSTSRKRARKVAFCLGKRDGQG